MSATQTILMVAMVALGTVITRALPFWLFPAGRKTPAYITYLGRVLPLAVMGLLIVYSLKGVSVLNAPHGLPELIAILFIAALHRWKGNMLLSIAGGTILYMVLIQTVFAV